MPITPEDYNSDAIKGEKLERLANLVVQKLVDNGMVSAGALVELERRLSSVEQHLADTNIGDREADSLDAQSLKEGGNDVAESLSGKADKVSGATNGNFAALGSTGNLTDSGKKASDFEIVTNKVTSVRAASSATDTAYPSEKAVADVAAALHSKTVAFADATYRRTDTSPDGEWFKIASLHPAGTFKDALASFDLFYGQLAEEIFKVNVRIDVRLNGNGTVPTLSSFVTERTSRDDFGLRVVTRGTVGNCDIELWVSLPKSNISMALKMVAGSDLVDSDWKLSKDKTWTFYSSSNGGTSIPVEDASSNVYVYKTTESKLLYSIPATGIPKTALASSVQTSLDLADSSVQNIAYVANQSGGGGNLNKTINGTPTSVLTFMNDSEAVAIWADAKTAAANAS